MDLIKDGIRFSETAGGHLCVICQASNNAIIVDASSIPALVEWLKKTFWIEATASPPRDDVEVGARFNSCPSDGAAIDGHTPTPISNQSQSHAYLGAVFISPATTENIDAELSI